MESGRLKAGTMQGLSYAPVICVGGHVLGMRLRVGGEVLATLEGFPPTGVAVAWPGAGVETPSPGEAKAGASPDSLIGLGSGTGTVGSPREVGSLDSLLSRVAYRDDPDYLCRMAEFVCAKVSEALGSCVYPERKKASEFQSPKDATWESKQAVEKQWTEVKRIVGGLSRGTTHFTDIPVERLRTIGPGASSKSGCL